MAGRLAAFLTGDWDNAPHGPADAPRATAEDRRLYAAQGHRCACTDCQCYGHYTLTRKNW